MNIAICGPGRAGKDTTALWFRDHTALKYVRSTSEAAAELCYEKLKPVLGYASVKAAFDDRHAHRVDWANIIWDYNKPDGLRLYRDMLKEGNILNGIRRAGEIRALQDGNYIDLTIWIDRDVPNDPSCEMTADDADIVVRNYGSFDDLYLKLQRLARALNVKR